MGAADFHILALDYRGKVTSCLLPSDPPGGVPPPPGSRHRAVSPAGYGDSSGYPTESGFTTDVLALYDWAKERSGNSSILFWGHSLGTGYVRWGALSVLVDAKAHSWSPGCDTAARPVPPGVGPRGWSSSLVEAPAKQNPAGEVEGLVLRVLCTPLGTRGCSPSLSPLFSQDCHERGKETAGGAR